MDGVTSTMFDFRRICAVVITISAVCLTFSCKKRASSSAKSISLEAQGSLAMQLQNEKADLSSLPMILPSVAWQKMKPEEKLALIQMAVGGVISEKSESRVQALLMANFGIPAEQSLPADSVQANKRISELIVRKVDENPSLLDHIPAIELERIPAIQSEIASFSKPPILDSRSRPSGFPELPTINTLVKLVSGSAQDCPPQNEPPLQISGNIMQTNITIDKAVPCFITNSKDLATAFNWLSNEFITEPQPVNFKLQIDTGPRIVINSTAEFLSQLTQAGFTIEVFSTRYIVEFKQIAFNDGGELKSLRFPTWMIAPRTDALQETLAEHGELELMIHKDGQRYAQVRWYAGLPVKNLELHPAHWRYHPEKSSVWQQPMHDFVEVYKSSAPEKLEPALQWFKATSKLMEAFNIIMRTYGLPINSYGQVVCIDSLIFAAEKVAEMRAGAIGANIPVTKAYPIFRSQVRPQQGSLPLNIIFSELAGIDNSQLESNYPQDYNVVKSEAKFKNRIAEVFPPDEAWRLQYFSPTTSPSALRNLAAGDSCGSHVATDCNQFRGCGWSRPVGKAPRCISIASKNCSDYSEDQKWCVASIDANDKLCIYANGQCQSQP